MRHVLVSVLLICLSGCGFHWRGQTQLAPPLQVIYIKAPNPYGTLAHNLRRSLTMSGTHIVEQPDKASMIFSILKEETSQQLLGINGSQQTRQYNLILTVTFEITTPHDEIVVPPQVITETRTLTIQADQMLASSNEANSLYQLMRASIVYKIMQRLGSQEITAIMLRQPS
jgi:LPS-assembly lipoprotein